ncbi:MAG: pectin acetylesterase-family hydrolase [Aquabacterium sp.]|nr:pectin acetylesterase-family hydrolase [Aquabacterium sp.]
MNSLIRKKFVATVISLSLLTGAIGVKAQALENITLANVLQLSLSFAGNLAEQAVQAVKQSDVWGVEPGNYNWWTTGLNMIWPQKVDAPLTSADQQLPYTVPTVSTGEVKRNLYYVWQQVTVPKSTGAACSDGSEYKFFVNLSPASNNLSVFFEPGGACTTYANCAAMKPTLNEDGSVKYDANGNLVEHPTRITASHRDGLSNDFMNLFAGGAGGIMSPYMSRLAVGSPKRLKTQDWNQVFMPYCTGDVFVGDNTQYLTRIDDKESLIYRHKGMHNVMAALGWMRTNLPRPAQVFSSGMSAGSIGVDMLRPVVRKVLNPRDTLYTMADSGFVLADDPINRNTDIAPAALMFPGFISAGWNYDPAHPERKTPAKLFQTLMPSFNPNDMNTFGPAAHAFNRQDRMLYVYSQSDVILSAFGYELNPARTVAAKLDGDINLEQPKVFNSNLGRFLRDATTKELTILKNNVGSMNQNVGYFLPSGRNFGLSHCLALLTYEGSYNAESGHDIYDAMNNLLNRNRPAVWREMESDGWRGLFTKLGPTSKAFADVLGSNFYMPTN